MVAQKAGLIDVMGTPKTSSANETNGFCRQEISGHKKYISGQKKLADERNIISG